jgi:peptidoglycan/LPS O-acetylase OafA/YrhL
LGVIAHPRYVPALDGIRGIAIIWVVFHNTTFLIEQRTHGWQLALVAFAHTGWMGVQLFFALSGYLITAGLLATQGAAHYFRDFYARRALRILPLYYAVIFVVLYVLPHLMALPGNVGAAHQASLWLFLTNWTGDVPYGFSHFWSLAVEEQFYIVWPLLVFRLAPGQLLRACIWVAAGALLMRLGLGLRHVQPWTIYSNTICRMDALALGAAVACVLALPEASALLKKRLTAVALATALVFVLGALATSLYDTTILRGQTFGYTLLSLCSASFVLCTVLADDKRWGITRVLASSVLRSFGKYSYGIYVVHNLIHKLIGEPILQARFGKQPAASIVLVYAVIILGVSYVVAVLTYHGLERHFLRLKGLFQPQRLPVADSRY